MHLVGDLFSLINDWDLVPDVWENVSVAVEFLQLVRYDCILTFGKGFNGEGTHSD